MLSHLLTGCPTAQADGRHRWRLGKVLSEIAKSTDLQKVKAKKDQFLFGAKHLLCLSHLNSMDVRL